MVEFNNPPTTWNSLSNKPSDFLDGKIDWDEVGNKPLSFPPTSHNHAYLPLSGGTLSGGIETEGSGFYTREVLPLPTTVGSNQQIKTLTGMGANWISERVWLCRKGDGTNWLTVIIHNGITVDSSFLSPRIDTRTWWDRDIAAGSHSWGNGSNTFLSLGEGGFFRIPISLPSSAIGLLSGQVWRDSNGFLRIV